MEDEVGGSLLREGHIQNKSPETQKQDEDRAKDVYTHILEARAMTQAAAQQHASLLERITLSTAENTRIREELKKQSSELSIAMSRLQQAEGYKRAHVCGVTDATRKQHTLAEAEHLRLRSAVEEQKQYLQGLQGRNAALQREGGEQHVRSTFQDELRQAVEKQRQELGRLRSRRKEYDQLLSEYDSNLGILSLRRTSLLERKLDLPTVSRHRRMEYEAKEREEREGGHRGEVEEHTIPLPPGSLRYFVGKTGDGLMRLAQEYHVEDPIEVVVAPNQLRIRGDRESIARLTAHVEERLRDIERQDALRDGMVTYATAQSAKAAEIMAARIQSLLLGTH